MSVAALSPKVSVAAPDALFVPFTSGELAWPASGEVAFLGARDCVGLHTAQQVTWRLEQPFKPFADALVRAGWHVADPLHDDATIARYSLVLVLPPRQRDAARALFARALSLATPNGIVVASMANNEGARSGEADLRRLAGPVHSLSKHKCRVFWTLPPDASVDRGLLAEWTALGQVRPIGDGRFVSRPGLFSWDRIDPASALLAAQLPATLAGRVADLGAGFGYLAAEVLRRCARVSAIDLYEADARALESARINCARAAAQRTDDVAIDVLWHDVTTGLSRRYDAIVSNPPFHQGRADDPQLGRAFIAAAAAALEPDGSLWMVANRHLAYEATLAAHFANVRVVVVQDGFKVIEASGARA